MQSVGILEPLLGHVASKIPAVESRLSSNQTVRLSGCGLKYRKTASRQQHALMPLKPWCLLLSPLPKSYSPVSSPDFSEHSQRPPVPSSSTSIVFKPRPQPSPLLRRFGCECARVLCGLQHRVHHNAEAVKPKWIMTRTHLYSICLAGSFNFYL